MTDQIVSRDHVRAKARIAFESGQSRDSHAMNWHAPALADWLAEYDRLVAQRHSDLHQDSRRRLRETTRGSQ